MWEQQKAKSKNKKKHKKSSHLVWKQQKAKRKKGKSNKKSNKKAPGVGSLSPPSPPPHLPGELCPRKINIKGRLDNINVPSVAI